MNQCDHNIHLVYVLLFITMLYIKCSKLYIYHYELEYYTHLNVNR